jgi:hypothetical protein
MILIPSIRLAEEIGENVVLAGPKLALPTPEETPEPESEVEVCNADDSGPAGSVMTAGIVRKETEAVGAVVGPGGEDVEVASVAADMNVSIFVPGFNANTIPAWQ